MTNKNQLSTAESQFDLAQSYFPALTPANFNYNSPTYLTTLNNLETVEHTIHTALKQAGNDLHQIAQILKSKTMAPGSGTNMYYRTGK